MRIRIGRRLGAVAASLALMSLAACGGGTQSSGGEAATGGGDSSSTLTVAWTAAPTQLDPLVFTSLNSVYINDAYLATLLEYDQSVGGENGRVIGVEDLVPSLAESYEANEDGTRYTFKLRKGVKSAAGNELTADDVVWTFERFYSSPSSLQAGVLLPTGKVDREKPMEKIDDYTVRYNLTAPSPVALSILAYPILGIIDSTEAKKHATKDDPWATEWLKNNTAGFGAYTVSSFNPGNEVRLTANPNYFGDKPDFTQVIIRSVPDGAARAQMLMSGSVDIISEPPIDQLKAIEDSGNARVTRQPDMNRHNLSVNHDDPILGKAEVRRAISMAINRDALIQAVYKGYAKPALTPIASELFPQEQSVRYDPEAAKRLLAEAGHPNGFDMELTISSERPGPYSETLARLIQTDLQKIGVNVTIKSIPSVADFEEAVSARKLQAYLYTERPSQPDPGFDLFLYLYKGSSLNKSGYANPRLDALTDRSLAMLPGAERDKVLKEAIGILAEDEPIISLVEIPYIAGVNKRVDNFIALPSGTVAFHDMKRG